VANKAQFFDSFPRLTGGPFLSATRRQRSSPTPVNASSVP
jgi:hypothetical protein